MRALTLSFAALLISGTGVAAETLAFEGRWDCEVAEFTFTQELYNNGSDDMPINDIAPDGDGFVLTFQDNYQLYLAVNDDGTLYWFSPASGDTFTCQRLG